MRHLLIAEALQKEITDMKHFLNKKNKIMGAGIFSKPKPPKPKAPEIKIATLKPPKLGNAKVMASYDFLEVLELISDGPIEGLVNKNGVSLRQLSLFQGVYLDGTPVLETDNNTVPPKASQDSGYSTESLTKKRIAPTLIEGFGAWIAEIQTNNILQPDQVLNVPNDRKDFNPIIRNNEYLADGLTSSDFQHYFQRNIAGLNALFFVGNGTLNRSGMIPKYIKLSYWNLLSNINGSARNGYRQYMYSTDIQVDEIKHPEINVNKRAKPPILKRIPGWKEKIYKESFVSVRYDSNNKNLRAAKAKAIIGLGSILSEIMNYAAGNDFQGQLAKSALQAKYGSVWPYLSVEYIMGDGGDHLIVLPIRTEATFNPVSVVNDVVKDPITGLAVPRSGTVKDILVQFTIGAEAAHDINGSGDGFTMQNVILPIVDSNGLWGGKTIGFSLIRFDQMDLETVQEEVVEWGKKSKDDIQKEIQKINLKRFQNKITEAQKKEQIAAISKFENSSTLRYYSNSRSIRKSAMSLVSRIDSLYIVDAKYAFSTRKKSTLINKYNYSNIFVEFRNGEEYQAPMQYFNNIMFDHFYSVPLLGPFRLLREIQKLNPSTCLLTNPGMNITSDNTEVDGLNGEGSNDIRTSTSNLSRPASSTQIYDFGNWNKTDYEFDEVSIPTTHIVVDPNAEQVFISLEVSSLMDTLVEDKQLKLSEGEADLVLTYAGGADETTKNLVKANIDKLIAAGTPIPAIVVFEIAVGHFDENNKKIQSGGAYKFQIVSLIQSSCHIDIGNPDLELQSKEYSMIKSVSPQRNIYTPFQLPSVEGDYSGKKKRYVEIRKVSCETNSVLVQKTIGLIKVTEMTKGNLSFPFSAIIGTKIDGRSFSSVPSRIFDCKLKKVKIPSNYHPNEEYTMKDKRYVSSSSNYKKELIYKGDWNGSFKKNLEYTDNPAWILYDLLTSQRYGLGSFLKESQIDIWDLYKIGRFCDNVDDAGYFIGVSDGNGGLEPRYSCNILFQEGEKIYDAISIVCALFRGSIYYHNSKLNFVDDRVKKPTALFTNANVKGGDFNYTNNKRDEQFNVVEVAYIDRFENFETKIELAEDQEDIRKRGVFKTTINAMGVTSKSMAKRIAEHVIFSTIKENQSVSFVAGAESLLCKPGDLIMIEDELKSLSSNFGKILDFNQNEGWIRVTNEFSDLKNNAFITCWVPTGSQTKADLAKLALADRYRLNSFYFNSVNNRYPELAGEYVFDGYLKGFDSYITNNPATAFLDEQYAFYKGSNDKFCYFSTDFTGWVLGQGDMFDKSKGKVIYGTQDQYFYQANNGFEYDFSASNGRGASRPTNNLNTAGSNKRFRDTGDLDVIYQGISNDDIELSSPSQIVNFVLSGFDNSLEYGCKVFVSGGSINYNLIQFLKLGSVCRFQRKNSDDMIYKVINIREENPNEYGISASLFNTGKYKLIENFIQENEKTDTYPHTLPQLINGISYETLTPPFFTKLYTGYDDASRRSNLYIGWSGNPQSEKIKGYEITITDPNYSETLLKADNINYEMLVSTPFQQVGFHNVAIKSMGLKTKNVKFYDSEERSTGILILDGKLLTSTASTIKFSAT